MLKYHFGLLVAGTLLIIVVIGQSTWYAADDGTDYLIDLNYQNNWYEALLACTSHNLTLATIDSEEKYLALKDLLQQVAGGIDFWIGGLYSTATGHYHWTATGFEIQNTHWSTAPFTSYKECVYMKACDFLWASNDCFTVYLGSLCERRPRLDLLESSEVIDNNNMQEVETQLKAAKLTIDSLLGNLVSERAGRNGPRSLTISVAF